MKIPLTIHLSLLIVLLLAYAMNVSATESLAKKHQYKSHQYTVNIQQDLSQLRIKACFAVSTPEKLVSYQHTATDAISDIILSSGKTQKHLRAVKNTIALPSIKKGDCVSYKVAIKSKTTHSRFNRRQSTHQQILLNIHHWLWFPSSLKADAYALDITFKLPRGISVSTPWRQISKNTHSITYRYDSNQRPPDFDGRIAIGHFKTVTRTRGNAQINIAILNGKPAVKTAETLHWIDKNLDALMLAYGEFPVPKLQLLIVPVGRDIEPVPWGQVMRGGGEGVHLYIDQTRPLQEFIDDWVLIHELSHLLHPWISSRDAWLSEGLASYYQNVLGARVGRLSPHAAWRKLHQGFQRGIRGTSTRRNLAQVTKTMMRDRAFMRVYWSGAAISLLADHALRKQTNNTGSLDSALAEFQHCCLPSPRKWTAWEVMQKLDAITKTRVFTQLYRQNISSTHFPDLTNVYKELGLAGEQDEIKLINDATLTNTRHSIMSTVK